jgi:hypothetical protein
MIKEQKIKMAEEKMTKLVHLFKCKAIDCLDDLTNEIIEETANDIDTKLNNYKKRYELVVNKYDKTQEEMIKLENKLYNSNQALIFAQNSFDNLKKENEELKKIKGEIK